MRAPTTSIRQQHDETLFLVFLGIGSRGTEGSPRKQRFTMYSLCPVSSKGMMKLRFHVVKLCFLRFPGFTHEIGTRCSNSRFSGLRCGTEKPVVSGFGTKERRPVKKAAVKSALRSCIGRRHRAAGFNGGIMGTSGSGRQGSRTSRGGYGKCRTALLLRGKRSDPPPMSLT